MNTNTAIFTIDNLSAFELEDLAQQIFADCPASVRTMAAVSKSLELARIALCNGNADDCTVAVEAAAAAVYTRSGTAYRSIMARFDA